jgi:hypothetical protein
MVAVRCHSAMMTSTDMMRVRSSETTDGQIPMTTAIGICGSLWGFVGLCEDTMAVAKTTSKTKKSRESPWKRKPPEGVQEVTLTQPLKPPASDPY